MRLATHLALAASLLVVAPASAAAPSSIVPAVTDVISGIVGIPIVTLARYDNDPSEFWYRAMQQLCDVTGDNWCEEDLHFLQDTTNQAGWARRFSYTGDNGAPKEVCVVLPPRPGLDAGYIAMEISGSAVSADERPNGTTGELWVWLNHVANCGLSASGSTAADAFATLATTLIEGDTDFVPQSGLTDARYFSSYRHGSSNRWAVNIGERILLDYWKAQSVDSLRRQGCQADLKRSGNLDTDAIRLDRSLGDKDCNPRATGVGAGMTIPSGTVSDENLWLWSGKVGLPPVAYSPFGSFTSIKEGVNYAWTTALGL